MSTGAILFGVITLVTIVDILVALYFRSLAARVENGETVSSNINPENIGKIANMLLVSAPLIWLVVTLISFGVIPSGIDPIQF